MRDEFEAPQPEFEPAAPADQAGTAGLPPHDAVLASASAAGGGADVAPEEPTASPVGGAPVPDEGADAQAGMLGA